MRPIALLLLTCAAFVLSPGLQAADALPATLTITPYRYLLGPGDKLRLTLFGQREFDADLTVDVSGNVAVPLLKNVHASGLSLVELSKKIETALIESDYYLSPHVTVALLEARPFMIEGDVAKPGGYPFEADLTVRRAFVWAGGYSSTPKMSYIIGMNASSQGMKNTIPTVTIFRKIDGVDETINADEDTPILPGDIVNIRYSLSFLSQLNKAR